jgi:hypothetical protein
MKGFQWTNLLPKKSFCFWTNPLKDESPSGSDSIICRQKNCFALDK